MVKGEGRKWAEGDDDDEECVVCASQWQSRVRPHHADSDAPMDSVGIEQESGVSERFADPRVEWIDESGSDRRVRSPGSRL